MRGKSESRRQAIVEIAREVFQTLGFEATSMSEIAARVGGSKATLYNYFSSKEELFVEVMRQSAESLVRNLFDALDASLPPEESLMQFGLGFVEGTSQPVLTRNYRNAIAEAHKSTVGRLFYERGPQEGLRVLARHLEACMARGALRREDGLIAAQQLFGLLRAEIQDKLLLGVIDSIPADEKPRMARRAVEVFLRAYRPDAG
ncbi:MAG: TetR/AcrR family transcriptional regulator [Candidatus Dactylopiibacterium sp.]|nr:TetR/AcrR family transcriptional regulator [Candidatus Dactylopiibacterium sp.]